MASPGLHLTYLLVIYALVAHKPPQRALALDNQTAPAAIRDRQLGEQREFVKSMMRHAWHGYARHAWGHNEVRPVSRVPHLGSVFGDTQLGATIVDAIDTLHIMGLEDEYLAARTWIELNLNLNKFDADLSVFETNIRFVGGLLSTYALTKDRMFLDKAAHVADKLLPAFDTPSGVPMSSVNVRTGKAHNNNWAQGASILAEFGSYHLEFVYLSQATGDPKYLQRALKIRKALGQAAPREDGLYNTYFDPESGRWLAEPLHVSMGALGDSFYEYLIKAYVQSDKRDTEALEMYLRAIKAFEDKLVLKSEPSQLVYFADFDGSTKKRKMGTLACFAGGMLAMGAMNAPDHVEEGHIRLAKGIADTCRESCARSASHLGPETFVFSKRAEAVAFGADNKHYLLRPEIPETYFYLWRYTRDPKYRAWAWDFVEALEKYCKSEAGYSGIRNVYEPSVQDDVQQSYFLAETLKYLYLIFADDATISLNEWVFNTEAHPLPILKSNSSVHA